MRRSETPGLRQWIEWFLFYYSINVSITIVTTGWGFLCFEGFLCASYPSIWCNFSK